MASIDDFLVSFAERHPNGLIDFEKTRQKFVDKLVIFSENYDEEYKNILSAIDGVFEEFPDKPMRVDEVCTFALIRLNVQPENHDRLSKLVRSYLKENIDPNGRCLYKVISKRPSGLMKK